MQRPHKAHLLVIIKLSSAVPYTLPDQKSSAEQSWTVQHRKVICNLCPSSLISHSRNNSERDWQAYRKSFLAGLYMNLFFALIPFSLHKNTATAVLLLKISLQHISTLAAGSNACMVRCLKPHDELKGKASLSFSHAIWATQLFWLGKQDSIAIKGHKKDDMCP